MSRYIRNEAIGKPADFVDFIMSDFLQKYGFTLVKINGEMVYQKGKGLFEMPQYFSYRYANGIFHIEAWVKFAWLPGVYGKEKDLSGVVGSIPKKAYKESIDELIRVLYQPLPGNQQNPYGGMNTGMPNGYGQPAMGNMNAGMPNSYGQPAMGNMNAGMPNGYGQPAQGGPITVRGVDLKKRAKTGFVMSIVGAAALAMMALVLFVMDASEFRSSVLVFWTCGMVYAGLGTGYCYRGMSSSKSGLATAGFAMGVIELIAGVILLVKWMM